jgi:tight adherence protein C
MNQMLIEWMTGIGHYAEVNGGKLLRDHVKTLDAQVISAGEPAGIRGRQLLGIQITAAIIFPFFWGYILSSIPIFDFMFNGPHQILVFLFLIAIGFYFPQMNIKDRIKTRHQSISLELPDVIDLLTVCVEAGLDFMGALRTVVDHQKEGPLKSELNRFMQQLELGRTRQEALREMAVRVGLSDLMSVSSALIQAARLGSPLGPVLRAQSDMVRIRRGQKAEKAAMEAAVKMMAPLLLCIFPAVFIMILAPVIIQMAQNW